MVKMGRIFLVIFFTFMIFGCSEQPKEDLEDFVPGGEVPSEPSEPEIEYSPIEFAGLDSISNITSITAQLNWTHVAGAFAYLIYDHSGESPVIIKVVPAPATSTRIEDLSPETTYQLSVKILDGQGLQDDNTVVQEITTQDTMCFLQTIIADNPRVFYRMDETAGATANDLGSAGIMGDYLGGYLFGQAGGIQSEPSIAVEFNGTDGHIDLGNPPELQLTGDQTIEMWVYPNALSGRQNPYAKAYGGEGTITIEPSGQINYYYGTAGANTSPYQGFGTGAGRILANEWTHIALVRDLTNMRLYWYINGVEVNNANANYAAAVVSSNNAFIAQGYVNNFNGRINNFAIYDQALSAGDIQAHYDAATIGCP